MTMQSPDRAGTLLICAPAPVEVRGEGWYLDVKFVEGMRDHARQWGGPLRCVLWQSGTGIPFGAQFRPQDLPFELIVLAKDAPLPAQNDIAVALLSADMPGFERYVAQMTTAGIPVVAGLEYTLHTRLQMIGLDRQISLPRKLRRVIWQLGHERRLRRALAMARGVQFNGYPAFGAHRDRVANPMLYLDNRMGLDLMVTGPETGARRRQLLSGAPLRLIHSGRLEPIKGAQDLLPVMRALRKAGVSASLDIYGTGSLEGELRAGLAEFDGQVRLHGPVDFARELVPLSRSTADIFLSCHRQSDPSCSYLEAMGCGLAVVGYDNRMWAALAQASGGGVAVPMGKTDRLAAAIAAWDRDRAALISICDKATDFARQHSFEAEFAARMDHLRRCAT